MHTKDKIFKIIIPCFIIVIALTTALLLFFLPKNKNLTINAKNLTLTQGQEQQISYDISNPYATVTFKVDNTEIIEIRNFKIVALKTGSTFVTLNASFSNQKASTICQVKVLEKDDSNKPTEEKPSQPEPENPDKPNLPQEPSTEPEDPSQPTTPNQPEQDKIKFDIIAEINCETTENSLKILQGKTAIFKLSFNQTENKELYDQLLMGYDLVGKKSTISKMSSGYAWKISATEDDEISIVCNKKVIGKFKVILK